MTRIQLFSLILITIFSSACGSRDERIATSFSPSRQVYYDFFNDIRLEIAELEPDYKSLEGFTEMTKTYLESKESQRLYQLTGVYFEKNKNREQGAYEYEDRFFVNGSQLHFIVYPPEEKVRYETALGVNKGYGKQVGQNYVYYQVFTANPTDEVLENKIKTIVENNIQKHAQYIDGID